MMQNQTYVAFLRGINVGRHHRVPMAELRKILEIKGLKDVQTLLNSGNAIFNSSPRQEADLGKELTVHLEEHFGFPIAVIVRTAEDLKRLVESNPFGRISLTPDLRLYVTFLRDKPERQFHLPATSEDESFQILSITDKIACSVLDLSVHKTPKGMEMLETLFGKNITTRNWNTLNRIVGKIKSR